MDVRVELKGNREFQQQLNKLKDATAEKIMRRAIRSGARIVQQSASQKAPKSRRPTKAGHLADNIIIKVSKDKDGGISARVGPDSKHFYGRFVERGYHHIFRGKSLGRKGPRAFMRPALDENEERIQAEIRKTIERGIKRALKRGG